MISCELLGAVEKHMRQTIYGGVCEKHTFGGIPVVLIVGDDFQLPPVQIGSHGKGAFHIYNQKQISNRTYYKNKCQMRNCSHVLP